MISNITKRDMNFINMALEASEKSTMSMQHGCVVTYKNKYIASGYNSHRNKFKDNFVGESCSCHAEMHALRNALKAKKITLQISEGKTAQHNKIRNNVGIKTTTSIQKNKQTQNNTQKSQQCGFNSIVQHSVKKYCI